MSSSDVDVEIEFPGERVGGGGGTMPLLLLHLRLPFGSCFGSFLLRLLPSHLHQLLLASFGR
jgi:hypothetical protein